MFRWIIFQVPILNIYFCISSKSIALKILVSFNFDLMKYKLGLYFFIQICWKTDVLNKHIFIGLLHSFLKLQKQYGSFYKLWLGSRLHLMISKPEYLEQLLNSNVHLSKSDGYDLFKPWLGDGLLVSTGKHSGYIVQNP